MTSKFGAGTALAEAPATDGGGRSGGRRGSSSLADAQMIEPIRLSWPCNNQLRTIRGQSEAAGSRGVNRGGRRSHGVISPWPGHGRNGHLVALRMPVRHGSAELNPLPGPRLPVEHAAPEMGPAQTTSPRLRAHAASRRASGEDWHAPPRPERNPHAVSERQARGSPSPPARRPPPGSHGSAAHARGPRTRSHGGAAPPPDAGPSPVAGEGRRPAASAADVGGP